MSSLPTIEDPNAPQLAKPIASYSGVSTGQPAASATTQKTVPSIISTAPPAPAPASTAPAPATGQPTASSGGLVSGAMKKNVYNPTGITAASAGVSNWNVNDDQLVEKRANNIIQADNPLMQRAAARAAQSANARGLINSSMAVGASQTAVLDAATDIAKADAGTYAQSAMFNADSSNKASMFNAGQSNQWNMNSMDKDWQSGESSLDRDWRTGERVSGQDWQAGQSDLDRNWKTGERVAGQDWQTGESIADRTWKSGERVAGQDWQAGQSEIDRGWKTGERESGQTWQSGESDKDRTFKADESGKDRDWRTGERESGQSWQSGESTKDRTFKSTESDKDRTWQSGESAIDRDWKTGEAATDRDWRTGERESGQTWQSDENNTQRDFTAGESGKSRDFQTGERQANQNFQAGQAGLDRDWKSGESSADRQARVDEYKFNSASQKEIKELDFKYQKELNDDDAVSKQYGMYVDEMYKIDSNPDLDAPAKEAMKATAKAKFEGFAKVRGLKLDLNFTTDPADSAFVGTKPVDTTRPENQTQGNFDEAAYRAANPDVRPGAWDGTAWEHYQMYGQREGREFTPAKNLISDQPVATAPRPPKSIPPNNGRRDAH